MQATVRTRVFLGSGYLFSIIESKLHFYGYIFPLSIWKHLGIEKTLSPSLSGSPHLQSAKIQRQRLDFGWPPSTHGFLIQQISLMKIILKLVAIYSFAGENAHFVHSLKLTAKALKIGRAQKVNFIFQPLIFRGELLVFPGCSNLEGLCLTGVITSPTHTIHCYKGNPSKLP